MTTIREALKAKQAIANDASHEFDFAYGEALASFWRQATPGTTYWRGYLPMTYLPGQVLGMETDLLSIVDETVDPPEIALEGQQGVAIWQFLGDDQRSRIARALQRQGVPTVMEVDDNYLRFAPPLYGKHGAWTKTHEEAVMNGTGYSVEMHRRLVPFMDAMIVATDHLADEYAGWNDNVFVCPNSVDPTDWKVERVESETLRIGYYGSPSHVRDYPLVKKALKWAARQPGVEVVFAGFTPPGFSGTTLPWANDLFEARQNLGQMDVGIAPLTRNRWADGKSDVKALEYAMAGVLPIVQDAPPYSPWKAIGWPLMPKTEADWLEAIKEIVSERDSIAKAAAEAKDYVLRERTIQKNVQAWREVIDFVS